MSMTFFSLFFFSLLLLLTSSSSLLQGGGTDLNGSFATGCPWLPVHEGELQCWALGLDVGVMDVFGEPSHPPTPPQAHPPTAHPPTAHPPTAHPPTAPPPTAHPAGELGCRRAFPSAPLYFLNDDPDSAARYRDAYFSPEFGGGRVWRHGDFVSESAYTGGVRVHGRSDATLNPGGVRIGTAEIYRALDEFAREFQSVHGKLPFEESSIPPLHLPPPF